MDYAQAFGIALKRARNERGFTQEELVARIRFGRIHRGSFSFARLRTGEIISVEGENQLVTAVTILGTKGNCLRGIISPMTDLTFAEWLSQELHANHMLPSQLARAANLKTSAITKLLNKPGRNPSVKTCQLIARPLNKSVITVFRAAGYLPPESDFPEIEDFKELLSHLSKQGRKEMLGFVRVKLEMEKAYLDSNT